jgi:hypothetical protein
MTFTVINHPQRSPEWFAARLGRVTGSRAKDVLEKLQKGGESYKRRDYRLQLICERLTGQSCEEDYTNRAMQLGIEREPDARSAYEARTGTLVRETGFLAHTALMAGASLDGHVGDFTGLIEIKCPKPATHLTYLRTQCLPPEHEAQLRHNVWITGAEWADFVSYSPEFPAALQLFVVRVKAESLAITRYEDELRAFLLEVERGVEEVRTMAEGVA